ncbi:hypothetical protein [Rhizobium sp. LjRoot254]|uniref:hypothetical protein n=1 Tax=Rhizobium sp. LjRoot254 TaxID=3342297 RepID=UPI003ECE288F
MLHRLATIAYISFASLTGTAALLPVAVHAQALANSRYFPQDAILEWNGERYSIRRIDDLPLGSDEYIRIDNWMRVYPDRVEALQATVIENRGLAAALRAEGVQINNVGGIQQALNGGLVIFLR